MDALTFERVHGSQLQAIGFPASLTNRLFTKFTSKPPEDLEKTFELSPNTKDHQSGSEVILKSRKSLKSLSDVFILQHIWECDGGNDARKALLDDQDLLMKIENLLGIVHQEREGDRKKMREEMIKVVCQQTNQSESIARKALNDSGYDLIAAISLAQNMTTADNDALTTKDKDVQPSLTMEEFRKGFDGLCDSRAEGKLSDEDIEAMYNDWKTRKQRETDTDPGDWIHCYGYKWKYEEDGIITVLIPLPPNMHKKDVISNMTIRRWTFSFRGIKEKVIDGEFTGRILPDESYWMIEGESVCVSLQRSGVEGERWRELIVGEIQIGEKENERDVAFRVDNVMEKMWRVNQTYTAVTQEGAQRPVWYMMEAFGLALSHNSRPNLACHPFANALTGGMVTLIWPVMDVCIGDICTRDYTPSLHPGETDTARGMREAIILGHNLPHQEFQHQKLNNVVPSSTLYPPPGSPPSTLYLSSTSPIKIYISHGDKQPSTPAWECPGVTICSSVQNADVILGHHELLPHTFIRDKSCLMARIDGDQVLTHKTKFIQFTRENSNCVQGLNLRSEHDIQTLAQQQPSGAGGIVSSWYVVLPDGPWSSVPHHITNNPLEMIRLSEIGPGIATQFQHCSLLHDGRASCLQYSVVIVSKEGEKQQGSDGGRRQLESYLHTRPRVRLADKPQGVNEKQARFRQWNTNILLSSSAWSDDVQWDVFLSSVMETYKIEWSLVPITEMISDLMTAFLESATVSRRVTVAGLYTVDVLLLYKQQQLIPLIIGVDPIPSFSDSQVASSCLDLLLSRTRSTDNFVSL